MLNLKVNLLIKKIFIFFSLFIFCGMSTFGMENNTDKPKYETIDEQNDFERYAKVVIIGEIGSGKTTTWEHIAHPYSGDYFAHHNHTDQIDKCCSGYKIENKNIGLLCFDTSAEKKHEFIIYEFCHNANVVIVTVSAKDLVKPLFVTNEVNRFEELLIRLIQNSPNCRIIINLTQTYNMSDYLDNPGFFVISKISNYIKNIKDTISKKIKSGSINIDYAGNINLEKGQYGETLEHLIVQSLLNYGVENLPKNYKGMDGKIKEYKAVHKNIFGTTTDTYIMYKLNQHITGNKEKDTKFEKIYQDSICQIF